MELPLPEFSPTNIGCVTAGTEIRNSALAYSVGLYFALEHYCLDELFEQCYLFSKDLSPFIRSNLYYLLISFPIAIYTVISLVFSPNSTGISLCLESDSFNLLILFGWLVYAEESKQTSLEGFLVLRDVLVYGGALAFLGWELGLDQVDDFAGGVLVSYFLFWWILNGLNSTLQYRIMKLFNLLNDERVVSSELLLTQEPVKTDINELEDIILDNEQDINGEIHKFHTLLERAVVKERERKIHENFAMIVLSFKAAIEIKKQADVVNRASIYRRFWVPREDDYYTNLYNKGDEECEQIVQTSQCNVSGEKVEEVGEQKDEGWLLSVLKWAYLPVYGLSLATGRLKYISYMVGALLMVGVMFFINFSCVYLGQSPHLSPNLILLLVTPFLGLSRLRYFLKLPGHSDYDFCNIFLQAGIAKLCIVVGIGLLINGFGNLWLTQQAGVYSKEAE